MNNAPARQEFFRVAIIKPPNEGYSPLVLLLPELFAFSS
jgi:hypothetical protein